MYTFDLKKFKFRKNSSNLHHSRRAPSKRHHLSCLPFPSFVQVERSSP